MADFGQQEGEICWRDGCNGAIAVRPVENCSCHLHPPCSACTTPREYCQECDWQAKDDDGILNGYTVKYADRSQAVIQSWKPRPLDPRKIDWHSKSHTNASMIKEGVYPEGTTREEVREEVKGTFGGRFEYFEGGKFKYIAYTD